MVQLTERYRQLLGLDASWEVLPGSRGPSILSNFSTYPRGLMRQEMDSPVVGAVVWSNLIAAARD